VQRGLQHASLPPFARTITALRGKTAVSMALRFAKAARNKDSAGMSQSRVYRDVNVHQKPQEYWDYENMTLQWG